MFNMYFVIVHYVVKESLNINKLIFKNNTKIKNYEHNNSGTIYEEQKNVIYLFTVSLYLNKLQNLTALQFKNL